MTLCVTMICRNEERDIARALRSILPIADHVVVVDTGSTDATVDVIQSIVAADKLTLEVYTAASEWDGEWRLMDFSAARNHAVELAEATGCDWWLWIDADDELLDPEPVRQAMTLDVDVVGMWCEDNGRWTHHRMFRTDKHVRFRGRCHEYAVIDGLRVAQCDAVFRHDSTPHGAETSNARNRRLLHTEWIHEPSERTAFYLANTYRDAGMWDEAILWYRKRLAFGSRHREEWLFAQLYIALCMRRAERYEEAEAVLRRALEESPTWAEFWLESAYLAYDQGYYRAAIARCLRAPKEIPPSYLWRQPEAYKDRPLRLISWCHEHLGNLGEALHYGILAADQLTQPDTDWEERIVRLMEAKPTIHATAVLRPGAIGDVLMLLNIVPLLPKPVYVFCDHGIGTALDREIRAVGALAIDAGLWGEFNFTRQYNAIGYCKDGQYLPLLPKHLIQLFGDECGLDLKSLPETRLPKPPRPHVAEKYVTLQRKAGWSAYKEWFDERWNSVVAHLENDGYVVVEIGQEQGRTLAESIALIAHADFHLGIDSFGMHAAHLYGTRGVYLFGPTQVDGLGYPENVNLCAGLACSPCWKETLEDSDKFGVCHNLNPRSQHRCMAAITVDDVLNGVAKLREIP